MVQSWAIPFAIIMTTRALIHLLTEFAPVLSFFVVGQFTSFYTATLVLIIATIITSTVGLLTEKKLPLLPLISGFFVVSSGIITLVYQKPDALIFADSLYYFLMALAIAGGLSVRFNLLKRIFASTFAMTDRGWNILALRWVTIFLLAGIANELVRTLLTPDDWVDFKFIKAITIALFGFYQFTLSRKYRIEHEANAWGLRIRDGKD